jgi:phosphopantetheine--protein transferase-like protein
MNHENVLNAIAKLSRKKTEEISLHVSLGTLGLNSSFGLSALRSLLENQSKKKLPPFSLMTKVTELINICCNLNDGSSISSSHNFIDRRTSPVILNQVSASNSYFPINNISLGMDLQEIDSFELVADFRADPFYNSHFSDAEISTALLNTNTVAHLVGIFCAKEAAKKSHDDLLNLRMTDFHVTHSESGKPILKISSDLALLKNFSFLISITHTEKYAAATCITFGG